MSVLSERRDKKLLRATDTTSSADAAEALQAATGGDDSISVGTVYVNGRDAASAFSYRLTQRRLVCKRGTDPQVAGFAFADVKAFGSWEDDNGHLVVGIDIDGALWDLVLRPASRDPVERSTLVVRFLLGALRDAGATEFRCGANCVTTGPGRTRS